MLLIDIYKCTGKRTLSLLYIHGLRRDKSIHAFFSGFEKDRSNWINDAWKTPKEAIETPL
jgi:hypothetical protein